MNTRLILQSSVYVVATYSKADFLEAAYGTFTLACDRYGPTLRLAILLIHHDYLAGKETSLVATRTGTDLHLDGPAPAGPRPVRS